MKDRHTGEGRYPGLARPKQLDPGLRRGDEFKHLRAGSIICMIDQKTRDSSLVHGAAGALNYRVFRRQKNTTFWRLTVTICPRLIYSG
jgi:hypothetical protein